MTKKEKKEYQKKWYQINRERILEKSKSSVKNIDKEKVKEYKKEYHIEKTGKVDRNCLTCNQTISKYRRSNAKYCDKKCQQKSEVKKAGRRENRKPLTDEQKLKRNEYVKKRKSYDYVFRLSLSLRQSISDMFRVSGYSKKSRTIEILGCSFEEFKTYLENKFEDWMNWENKGLYNGDFNYGWDIDHIIPVSSASTEEELIKLNHYTNLQPLCSKINRDIKKDKVGDEINI